VRARGSMGGLDASTAGALIGKGVTMGIVHVLTGTYVRYMCVHPMTT
jgi:hypothetical protein